MDRKLMLYVTVGVIVGLSFGLNVLLLTGNIALNASGDDRGGGLSIGSTLPVIHGTDLDGHSVSYDNNNRPRIVYAALAGCPHCAEWSPKLLNATAQLGTDVLVLGYGDVETLVEELEEYRSRGDSVIIIDQAMLRRLNISGFPFTYIVDEMGKILHSWRGNSPSITTDIIETTINSFI